MEPINWNVELDKAILKRPSNTRYEMLRVKAKSWVTCAVGNQCSIIPRDSIWNEPLDKKLLSLGADFYYAFRDEKYESAKNILADIEIRSAELIKELVDSIDTAKNNLK